ncbi:MAG: hypothetical protein B6U68_02605, partial [Candidatus Aenigmarchaeota archaeon ex4484_14]
MADTPDVETEKSRWREFYYGDEKRMGFLQKIKMVLHHPSDFFEKVREERIEEAIKFYAILYFISTFLSLVLSVITGKAENLLLYLAGVLIATIFGVVGLLIFAGIVHSAVRFLKGKGEFY